MIIFGIIQSPEKDNDHLLVQQIAGNRQDADSIINAQINLTSKNPCVCDQKTKAWRDSRINPKEFYIQSLTDSKDSLGRPVLLGIFLKKEKNDSMIFNSNKIVEVLNKFSLQMKDADIYNIESLTHNYFTGTFLQRNLSCSVFICVLLALITFFLLNLGGLYGKL